MEIANYLSYKTIINEYLQDTGHKEEYSESWFIQKMSNCLDAIGIKGGLTFGISFLEVDNYYADLPSDFRLMDMAAFNYTPNKVAVHQVKEWTQSLGGCEYKTELICDETVSEQPVLEITNHHVNKMLTPSLGYSKVIHNTPSFRGNFKPMRLGTSSMRNIAYHTKTCVNLGLEGVNTIDDSTYPTYNIQNGKLITNFPSGQIVLAYYKRQTDNEGYPMIPDVTQVIDAIVAYIEFFVAKQNYRKNANSQTRTYWLDMKQEKNEKMITARSFLVNNVSGGELEYLANVWTKLVPVDRYENFWKEDINGLYAGRQRYSEYSRDTITNHRVGR